MVAQLAAGAVINSVSQPSNNSGNSGNNSSLISSIAQFILVLTLIALIVAAILIVNNWEAISIFFTTGFIGWLNPFDSPDGDTGPIESYTGVDVGGGIERYIVPAPFRFLFGR